MNTKRSILIFILAGLSFLITQGQKIGNYITNGSFEDWTDCNQPYWLYKVTGWGAVDSISQTGTPFSVCNGFIPNQFNTVFQLPRTGNAFYGSTFFIAGTNNPKKRWYAKNRLRSELQLGKTYCVKFHVNIMGMSAYGNDGFGIYFGDNTIDTITRCLIPLSYLVPQIKCQSGSPIIDTLGWTSITGTFVATGNEKYAIIGIFSEDGMFTTAISNSIVAAQSQSQGVSFTDACIDDVSCIEVNLQAYAGADTICNLGDSVFIGRQPDWAIDPGCIWYKLPNITTPIDTISGFWVKPTVTSTYVVRQEVGCSSIKWDTVIVTVNLNPVSVHDLNTLAKNLTLHPNPTSDILKVNLNSPNNHIYRKYCVTNAIGQTVLVSDILSDTMNIETSNLEPGLYQIHFRTDFGIISTKFIKSD